MIIAVDVGGTKTLVAGYKSDSSEPEAIFENKFPTPENYEDFKAKLREELQKYSSDISALSIALPAIVKDGKVVRFAHVKWGEIDILEDFKNDAPKIFINNDAALGALSEAHAAGNDYSRVLYVTLSTGIGTGFIIDKDIDRLLPTEGGHMIVMHDGEPKIWERVAAGSVLYKRYGEYAEDMTDEEQWKTYSYDVAVGLVSLSAVLLPDVIVLGGPVGGQLPKFKEFLMDHMSSLSSWYVPVPDVVAAEHPHKTVARGCFYAAKN